MAPIEVRRRRQRCSRRGERRVDHLELIIPLFGINYSLIWNQLFAYLESIIPLFGSIIPLFGINYSLIWNQLFPYLDLELAVLD